MKSIIPVTIATFIDDKIDLVLKKVSTYVVRDQRFSGVFETRYWVQDNQFNQSFQFEKITDAITKFESLININYMND